MKTYKVRLDGVKASNLWHNTIYALQFDSFYNKFKGTMSLDEINDKFYDEVISKTFKYGEYADLELVINEDLRIIDGRIIPNRDNES